MVHIALWRGSLGPCVITSHAQILSWLPRTLCSQPGTCKLLGQTAYHLVQKKIRQLLTQGRLMQRGDMGAAGIGRHACQVAGLAFMGRECAFLSMAQMPMWILGREVSGSAIQGSCHMGSKPLSRQCGLCIRAWAWMTRAWQRAWLLCTAALMNCYGHLPALQMPACMQA